MGGKNGRVKEKRKCGRLVQEREKTASGFIDGEYKGSDPAEWRKMWDARGMEDKEGTQDAAKGERQDMAEGKGRGERQRGRGRERR